ncbi:GrpB family protein [Maledivibacter halophilus]|uniref:Uncharacterized conserved protein n=1 Tax=Maledivibacter halophilus TaxID=36842 RepID=A0A1T5II72_9FIRM|nr:GrpB family protein [Maledivibacter halophilus]SKC38871.1 Uncharacterized conserved protein [Maledivibacter halophilus]
MRNNKEVARLYGRLKQELSKRYPNDINSYIEGETELITSILKSEGMALEELERIDEINRKK